MNHILDFYSGKRGEVKGNALQNNSHQKKRKVEPLLAAAAARYTDDIQAQDGK